MKEGYKRFVLAVFLSMVLVTSCNAAEGDQEHISEAAAEEAPTPPEDDATTVEPARRQQ